MQIFEVILFFKLRTIQQKTVKPTYLCPLDARKLAEGKNKNDSDHSDDNFFFVHDYPMRGNDLCSYETGVKGPQQIPKEL